MQHEYHRCPVTALAFFHEDILLAGEGNCVKVYKTDTNDLIKSITVFYSQAIHGIVVDQDSRTLLIWGGRYLRPISIHQEDDKIDARLGSVQSVDDWILDAAFLLTPDENHHVAALVTAHNALWEIRIDSVPSPGLPDSTLERAVSGSNCILYSAHLKWLSASHCLVASGTAFGDVILWSCLLESGKRASTKIHYTFSAHDGSVFGVQISPLLALPGHESQRRLLASCSDDRTVRLWDVSDLSAESPTLAQVQRDTGFGSRPETDAYAPSPLAKVMAHTSRIWHVRFRCSAEQSHNAVAELLSCGEDAYVNAWTINPGGADLPFALVQVGSKSAHSGKNIWSVAQHESGAFTTGGADGTIAQYLKLWESDTAKDVDRDLLNEGASPRNDNFKAYTFVSDNVLVSTTEHGRVVLIELTSEEPATKSLSDSLAGLRSYSVVTSLDGKAFVSGTDGAIYSYSHTPRKGDLPVAFSKIAQRSGKTAGFFAARLNEQHDCLLATGVGNAKPSLYFIPHEQAAVAEDDTLKVCQLELPENLIVTSFTICEGNNTKYALLGSRTGSLAIYLSRPTIATSSDSVPVPAAAHLPLVHSREAITSLAVTQRGQNPQSADDGSTCLFSSARDGTLAIHRLSFSNRTGSGGPPLPSLHKIHHLSLPFGPNIEGLYISPKHETISVWGFRGKQFVCYDASRQEEIFSIECGGAHRNWAFQPDVHGEAGCFVWTKAGKVFSSGQRNHDRFRTIHSGGHGREIKSVAISSALGEKQREIIATGAEDTNIKLFHLLPEKAGGWQCLQTLRKHNTGIQHLAWDGEYLFSSGGFEEFFVWRIETGCPCFGVGVVCVGIHPRSGKSDLRVCGFDVERQDNAGEGSGVFEIEMVYSDSTIKTWRYAVEEVVWELRAEGDYLTSCLTHVFSPSSLSSSRRILTASTDGHLALWSAEQAVTGSTSLPSSLIWLSRHATHQSAIHTLAHVTLPDASVLVATGGDDNAIAFTRISASSHQDEVTVKALLIPRAHAAAVTGLALIPDPGTEAGRTTFSLVSAGQDQRIKLWRVSVDVQVEGVEGVEVRKVHDVFTAVADVSSLELCTLDDGGKGIVVCGVGMDIWRLPPPTRTQMIDQ